MAKQAKKPKASYQDYRSLLAKVERAPSLPDLSRIFAIHGGSFTLQEQALQALRKRWGLSLIHI